MGSGSRRLIHVIRRKQSLGLKARAPWQTGLLAVQPRPRAFHSLLKFLMADFRIKSLIQYNVLGI
jgi:hypothetical protein